MRIIIAYCLFTLAIHAQHRQSRNKSPITLQTLTAKYPTFTAQQLASLLKILTGPANKCPF